jgi:subtilisin family serine protease
MRTRLFLSFRVLITIIVISLSSITLTAQDVEPGQLWVCVADSSGIPVISGDTITMEDDSLRVLFEQYGVYYFERAFPVVDLFTQTNKYLLDKVYLLKCNGSSIKLMIGMLNHCENIYYYVEEVPKIRLLEGQSYTPDDFDDQGLDYALVVINAQKAWGLTHGKGDVKIGISDGGFNVSHEDLANQIDRVVSQSPTGFNNLHGTFVAGCAAAETNNNTGKSSIGFDCKMYLYAISSNLSTSTDAFNSLLALSNAGAHVVNASWIYCRSAINNYHTDHSVIALINDNGTLIVAAAGNGDVKDDVDELSNGCDPYGHGYAYPASFGKVVSVTSIGPDSLHLFNQSQAHTHNDKVDVCAPGFQVLSTCFLSNSCYAHSSGTSFASPITAGLAGLVYSVYPCLADQASRPFRPEEVKHILESTAYNLDQKNPQYTGKLGHGLIDAYAAVLKMGSIPQGRDYQVAGKETWTDVRHVSTHIAVLAQGTLTIKGDVYFDQGASVFIEPGGTLVIDGGYLGAHPCSAGMWKGIEVRGKSAYSQFAPGYQGTVELKNGAVVKDALVAICTSMMDASGNAVPGSTGGMIFAENASFLDNQVAVEFYPYENKSLGTVPEILNNRSYFEEVRFETSRPLRGATVAPNAFVILNGVRGIDFSGCTFINSTPVFYSGQSGTVFPEERGTGILSYNSSFNINDSQLSGSEFKQVYYGIEAYGGLDMMKNFTVMNTDFDTVYRAIYASYINNQAILANHIILYNQPIVTEDTAYGIYLDHCSGFAVEENSVTRIFPQFQGNKHAGIIISQSGEEPNMIYRNTCSNLYFGSLVYRKNRSYDGNSGLKIYCNHFDACKYNIYVSGSTTDKYHGVCRYQGSMFYPAGNRFDCSTTLPAYSDYYNICQPVSYYHHIPTQSVPGLKPLDISATVTVTATNIAYTDTSCSPHAQVLAGNYLFKEFNEINEMIITEPGIEELSSEGISNRLTEKALAKYDQIRFFLTDSLVSRGIRKIIGLYDQDSTALDCFRIVMAYVELGDMDKAIDFAGMIPDRVRLTTAQKKDYQALMAFVKSLEASSDKTESLQPQLTGKPKWTTVKGSPQKTELGIRMENAKRVEY